MLRRDARLHAGEEHPRAAEADKELGAWWIESGLCPRRAVCRISHEGNERRGRVRNRAGGSHSRAVDGCELNCSGKRPHDSQTFCIDHLALWVKADFSLPARYQLNTAFERRAVNDPVFHRVGDTHLFDQPTHVRAAGCCTWRSMGDGATVEYCL